MFIDDFSKSLNFNFKGNSIKSIKNICNIPEITPIDEIDNFDILMTDTDEIQEDRE